ncbi:hypothetical protein TWF481_001427 [Arthrobotrys musiformis]|uniref:Uncharacterized protein n=1 Tax=Arthrobotrys musiformis TaxID=47236 RepID=A0AAV9WQI8_9PEZI
MGTINLRIPLLNLLLISTAITVPVFAIMYRSSIRQTLRPSSKKKRNREKKEEKEEKKPRVMLGRMPLPKSKKLWQDRKSEMEEGRLFLPILEEELEEKMEEAMPQDKLEYEIMPEDQVIPDLVVTGPHEDRVIYEDQIVLEGEITPLDRISRTCLRIR